MVATIRVIIISALPSVNANAGSGGGGMSNGEVHGEAYYFFPGAGEWGIVDTGMPILRKE